MKEILSLARLTGRSPEELQEQLFDGDKLVENWDSMFSELVLDRFKAQERKRMDAEFKRGVIKKAEEIEASLKPLAEKYGITFDRVEDGMAQLAEKLQAEPPAGGPEGLTPEQLRNLPQFQTAAQQEISTYQKKLSALKAEAEAAKSEKDKYMASQEAAAHSAAIKAKARQSLKALGASFGTDEEKAIDAFLAIYPASSFQAGETPTPLGPDGNPVTDKYGDPIPFDAFLKEKWFIGWADPSKHTPAPAQKGHPGSGKHFSSEAEYTALVDKAHSAGDWKRVQDLQKKFNEQLNNGGFPAG